MRRIASGIISLASVVFMVGAFALMFLPAAGAAPGGGLEVRGVALAHAMRGGSGYGSEGCRRQLAAVAAVGGNWVSLTDFAFMPGVDQPTVSYGRDRSSEGRGIAQTIKDAHAAGIKVLIKPHIWSRDFGGGKKWAADIRMNSETDWDKWFAQYSAYVLDQAKMAADHGADAISVGCELEGTSQTQEKRWRALVADVRKVFSGYVIYSAAFAEWQKVPWWDAVDCIGINAYMPLTEVESAGDEVLRAAWRRIYDQQLTPFQRKWNKPICFTEIGYTAGSKAAAHPWASDRENPSDAYQSRLYKVALDEAKKHNYVRGVFVWKWFTTDQFSPGRGGGDPFAIQNKPEVLEAIKQGFAR
jgi:hypothetical protein